MMMMMMNVEQSVELVEGETEIQGGKMSQCHFSTMNPT
jgi:hypothetical protein